MNTELERIEAEALKLSVEDFGGFATAEIQKYWLDEAERRIERIRSGEMRTRPADEVMAEVRARLKASRLER